MSFVIVPDGYSGMPLSSLEAVVLDTETTGLDTAKDRIIEIGAIRLSGGRIKYPETFSQLVDPGLPIPAKATEIHGITDADVADGARIGDALPAFAEWAGPAVVIGYAIGFDLAVMKAECARRGLAWRSPRSLDVRHLVQLVAPNLPEQSLDMAAAWLGIEIGDRHRALADAVATAQVFAGLVPKLRDRDITTLAQAERACRAQTARQDEEARAGWHETVRASKGPNVAEYARVDSFPYRHRVADLMNAPPMVADSQTILRDALKVMVEKRVSSLFLAPAEAHGAHGIITERDVMRAVEAHDAAALTMPIGSLGHWPLVTVERDEFAYRALARMSDRRFRHLGVVDGEGMLVGALSARDLLKQRADDAVSLGDEIETASTPEELGRVWAGLTTVARALVYEEVDARDIASIISRELRALTRRACELAQQDMTEAGRGPPPVPFALMVLGSGGRGESLLAMDQDNAIVFTEGEAGGTADQWFADLGTRLSDILNAAGVAYCKGGVMASNAAWRMDVAGWRKTVQSWIAGSRPQDILNCDIFFDALPVAGDPALAETLRDDALDVASTSSAFLKFLALNASQFEASVGWFGRLRTDGGRIDLKKGGIMPIFSAARVVALKHGISARSTPGRLVVAKALDVASPTTIDNLIEAHKILMNLILRQQLRDIDDGLALSNKVAPGDLAAYDVQDVKWALEQVPSVADLLDTPLLG